MSSMGRLPRLRALSSWGLVACLLLLARVPACDSGSCRMSQAERAACRQMGRDCCKPSAERFAHALAQPQLPDLFFAPVASLSIASVAGLLPAHHHSAPLPSPAIRGVSLYTLLATLLI
jgi:hypothetical protein